VKRMSGKPAITIRGAGQHNLKRVDLEIPLGLLIAVTGVSGSGKSSLAFDTLYREGRRRYLESLSVRARQFLGHLGRPDFERIRNLPAALAVDQRSVVSNPRSTVGTMSEVYDLLRLLFARAGEPGSLAKHVKLERRLFSFNSPAGACPACRGLGVQDRLDPGLLVGDPERSLREGALVLTTKSGYIVYSQVTMDVLDRVCRAHGFDVDIPWKDLSEDQRRVVLYGSRKIKIPFGKHPLESRLRWSGITAKPRKEGYYLGVIPVMQGILDRKRNPNILRFVRSLPCGECGGTRLRPEAGDVRFAGRTISDLADKSLAELNEIFSASSAGGEMPEAVESVRRALVDKTGRLIRLGLEHLVPSRASSTLSGGEARLIRLCNQVVGELRGLLYVLDEPTVGVHPRDTRLLLELLFELRDNGNTVLVVEHDEDVIRAADWVVDIGPGASDSGGEVLYNGPFDRFLDPRKPGTAPRSVTRAYMTGEKTIPKPASGVRGSGGWLRVHHIHARSLQDIGVDFLRGAVNAVTGPAGAGKSTLVHDVLAPGLRDLNAKSQRRPESRFRAKIEGWEDIGSVIEIDASPIGRTSRSNPATYTGLFDPIRSLFAAQTDARRLGYTKSRFSFNLKGGRCEACRGNGVRTIGMHFLGSADVECASCRGRRFNPETLSVLYRGKNIADVLDMPVEEALRFFQDRPAVSRPLAAMVELGLGYLSLGRPATTLSGGEAQRVKLAAELSRPASGRGLYILNEPTTGLHPADVALLSACLRRLTERGHTVVMIEHNPDVIRAADRVIDLEPAAGGKIGRVAASGTPEEVARIADSPTSPYLRARREREALPVSRSVVNPPVTAGPIRFRGVSTHNLRGIDVDFPLNRMTVVTGVSGSGKSSLVTDTVFAESRERFLAGLSTYARSFLSGTRKAEFDTAAGLTPAVSIGRSAPARNPRSTVGTLTGILDDLRLLYSRFGGRTCPDCGETMSESRCAACGFEGTQTLTARLFSFNHEKGACPRCRGLGVLRVVDPDLLISHPERSLAEGAMSGHKTGRFYGDPGHQYVHILRAVGRETGIDFDKPWKDLDDHARKIALYGAGDQRWAATWRYRRGNRSGTHRFESVWRGLIPLVNEEYARKHSDRRGRAMESLLMEKTCPACKGGRLRPEFLNVRVAGKNIADLLGMSSGRLSEFIDGISAHPEILDLDKRLVGPMGELCSDLMRRLRPLRDLGLEYLPLDRRTATLSGGELRRVRLAAQVGLELYGVTYLLDEPTIGLHPRDIRRLLRVLRELRDRGNTLIVVEHDPEVIRAADHIIDLGPGPGPQGGEVMGSGPLEVFQNGGGLTAEYLRGEHRVPQPAEYRKLSPGLRIIGAWKNNLSGFDLEIPSRGLIAVTGVSGSGKSTLMMNVVAASAEAGRPRGCRNIMGLDRFERVFRADQAPVSTSPVGTVAGRSGIFDPIRALFADTPTARERGWSKARFALSVKGGRCETCGGTGIRHVELDFLSDVRRPCEECHGRRYAADTLTVMLKGRSIADVLDLSVSEALGFFRGRPRIVAPLKAVEAVGLGYLKLGQASGSLSGGESQRMKLAVELTGTRRGTALYLFDEPTTGLHLEDVRRLLSLFHDLIDRGHTLMVIEHHPDVLRNADWIIDLGPEGGEGGGRVTAQGRPEALAAAADTATGKFLESLI